MLCASLGVRGGCRLAHQLHPSPLPQLVKEIIERYINIVLKSTNDTSAGCDGNPDCDKKYVFKREQFFVVIMSCLGNNVYIVTMQPGVANNKIKPTRRLFYVLYYFFYIEVIVNVNWAETI